MGYQRSYQGQNDKITLTISASPVKKKPHFDHDACAKGITATVDSCKFVFGGSKFLVPAKVYVTSADTSALT